MKEEGRQGNHYEVVRLHDYSNEELLARGDEMSLIMLFNKIQRFSWFYTVDLSEFLKLPREKLNDIVKDTVPGGAILDMRYRICNGKPVCKDRGYGGRDAGMRVKRG